MRTFMLGDIVYHILNLTRPHVVIDSYTENDSIVHEKVLLRDFSYENDPLWYFCNELLILNKSSLRTFSLGDIVYQTLNFNNPLRVIELSPKEKDTYAEKVLAFNAIDNKSIWYFNSELYVLERPLFFNH